MSTINYQLSSFPVSYQYDDYNEHTIRISKNVYSIDVTSKRINPDTQIKEFDSGINIEYIQQSCFINCQNLTDVNIRSNVRVIDRESFCNCVNLSNLTMDYVIGIGESAFKNAAIEKLTLDLRKIDDGTPYDYEDCGERNIFVGPYIGTEAFANCKKLTDVSLCTSTELSERMFSGCTSLSSVTFANHGQCVGSAAFKGCESLKTITLPRNFKMLSDNMFKDCINLERVNIDEDSPEFGSIGSSVFNGCTKLVYLELPKSITNFNRISQTAFSNSEVSAIWCKGIPSSVFEQYLSPFYESERWGGTEIISDFRKIYNGENLEYGVWFKLSQELINAAQENQIPLNVVSCGKGCGACENLAWDVLTKLQFQQWMLKQPLLFAYYDTNEDKVEKIGFHYEYINGKEKEVYGSYKTWPDYYTNLIQECQLYEDGIPFTLHIEFPQKWQRVYTAISGYEYTSNCIPKYQSFFYGNGNSVVNPDFKNRSEEILSKKFQCFDVVNGCLFRSADMKHYRWDKDNSIFKKVDL